MWSLMLMLCPRKVLAIAQGLLTDCQQLDDWFWMTDSLVTDWNSLLTPCLGCSSCQDNVSSTLRSAEALAMDQSNEDISR